MYTFMYNINTLLWLSGTLMVVDFLSGIVTCIECSVLFANYIQGRLK